MAKHTVPGKFFFCVVTCLSAVVSTYGQFSDKAKTGYLPDAAEEHWLVINDSVKVTRFIDRIKHLPINHKKGFIGVGINIREGYELFGNYLWGMGPQDNNGYFLHRLLLHSHFSWNEHVRLFAELESSAISGRNGGPRPIQDLNKMAMNQFFGEINFSVSKDKRTMFHFRFGKQSLNYGIGTLLDIRDANVRRSFAGGKLILEKQSLKLDGFFMLPVTVREGAFDDKIDHSQKVAGVWGTKTFYKKTLNRLDLYYIYINRDKTRFGQETGRETRNTIGVATSLRKHNWFSYCEADLQFGKFNGGNIRAWKIAPSVGYQAKSLKLQPVFTVQGAISSGDKDSSDNGLQTFNPLFPKAIYYGYIDNAGSANLIVVHPKIELLFFKRLLVTAGYYRFWRQQSSDGLYAINGSNLLPASNEKKSVGRMWDVLLTYPVKNHVVLQLMGSYYKQGEFLKEQPQLKGDIRYAGIKLTVRI
ncbi:alginate export family protein [Chitinophagaceae bacterium 26-R-25]|nr:alginate export family protein [Chitinophagaceae bacterium 26-R-25]